MRKQRADLSLSLEEAKLIKTILAELKRQADIDLSVFSHCKYKNFGTDLIDLDEAGESTGETYKQNTTHTEILFRPHNKLDHAHRNIQSIKIEWCSVVSLFEVEMYFEDVNGTTNSLGGMNNIRFARKFDLSHTSKAGYKYVTEIKIAFIKLYKQIEFYHEEILPDKLNKEFENAVYGAFPALLDDILMENFNDQKEEEK